MSSIEFWTFLEHFNEFRAFLKSTPRLEFLFFNPRTIFHLNNLLRHICIEYIVIYA